MKRIKIFKAYFVLWLFIYFIMISNIDVFKLYFLSTLTFNVAIATLFLIGIFMILKGAKDLVMLAGTFGVLMYKKRNVSFYIKGIEDVLPDNIAIKIKRRVEKNELLFTQQEKEDILAWIMEKFANQNRYNNFFIGTVLMIGLLGTFSGLLGSIGDMGAIVMSLAGSSVDIGKIMAGFSGPLSSMAVGFGSSLFGVIAAILLSIHGYLLNKSQESLIDGVENWLNKKTLEGVSTQDKSAVLVSDHTMEERNPSFTDIFVDKISFLATQIQLFNHSNIGQQQKMQETVSMLNENIDLQNKSFSLMQNQLHHMLELSEKNIHETSSSIRQSNQNHFENVKLMHQVLEVGNKQLQYTKSMDLNLHQMIHETQKQKKELKNYQEDKNIEVFEILESLEQMRSDIQKQINDIKVKKVKAKEEVKMSDFFTNYYEQEYRHKDTE